MPHATWGTSSVISTDPAGTAAPANTATTTSDTLNLGTDSLGLGAGTITVNNRSIGSIIRGSASSSGIITLQSSTIIFAADGFITNNATGTTLTINSTIAGGGTSMTFTNANSIGTNSYAGTSILNGVHRINSIANGGMNSTLGSSSNAASNLVFNDGAQLRYDGADGSTDRNFTIHGSSAAIYARGTGGNLTWNGTASFGTPNQAATLNLQNTDAIAGRGIFNGVLADNGTAQLSLTMQSFAGNGSWTLGAANTFTGSTTITSGLLILGNANALQRSSIDTTASATGTANDGLRTTGAALNLGGLSGNKNLSSIYTTTTGGYGSVTGITLNVALANNLEYSGVIDGARSLTKSGNGTQTLSGTNLYTGATTISAGTLRINGSLASGSAVTVGASGTLGGNGTIDGTLTVNGSLAPGNSIGTLNVANDVTWNGSASSPWVFELGAGEASDVLDITGISSDFLRGTGAVGTDFVFDFAGSTHTGTFDLVTWGGTTTFDESDFSYTNLGSGYTGEFQITGSSLQFVAVPEPTTLALLTCGGAVALALRHCFVPRAASVAANVTSSP
jgi:autotransporter-associated beta strand protein